MENNKEYNPDVLNCIANLSNDEVFTPPQLVNEMLDLLPQELFSNPKARFLDPFTKSGVFLREIVKRLDVGLASIIPDRQERILHIMHNQIFGIALTELTSLLARRSVYCSKYANSEHSVGRFKTKEGYILYTPMQHSWQNGRCQYCGASKEVFDRGDTAETYAYNFIHTNNPEKFFPNMTFDVIIGNPPYQLSRASENTTTNAAYASSIYHLFIEKACQLRPKYICMITPSRWMTKSAQGIPDEWVDKMITSNHFIEIHDFIDAKECFNGIEIKGGVNYFLYSPDYVGKCKYILSDGTNVSKRIDYIDSFGMGIIIRDNNALDILNKIIKIEGNYYNIENFSSLVSPRDFFTTHEKLGSNWKGYSIEKSKEKNIKYYLNKNLISKGFGWISKNDIPKGQEAINVDKVYISKAYGAGESFPHQIIGVPFYGEPGSVCSQTYIVIGYNPAERQLTKDECFNIISYIKTRLFRYLVLIKKKTQNAPRDVYQFVPLQDFSEKWTDEKLYKKYGLEAHEIEFIESMIKPME